MRSHGITYHCSPPQEWSESRIHGKHLLHDGCRRRTLVDVAVDVVVDCGTCRQLQPLDRAVIIEVSLQTAWRFRILTQAGSGSCAAGVGSGAAFLAARLFRARIVVDVTTWVDEGTVTKYGIWVKLPAVTVMVLESSYISYAGKAATSWRGLRCRGGSDWRSSISNGNERRAKWKRVLRYSRQC